MSRVIQELHKELPEKSPKTVAKYLQLYQRFVVGKPKSMVNRPVSAESELQIRIRETILGSPNQNAEEPIRELRILEDALHAQAERVERFRHLEGEMGFPMASVDRSVAVLATLAEKLVNLRADFGRQGYRRTPADIGGSIVPGRKPFDWSRLTMEERHAVADVMTFVDKMINECAPGLKAAVEADRDK